METKEFLDNKLDSIVSSMDLRSPQSDSLLEKDTTLADGNCAFNSFALGLCELVLADKLPDNKIFYETIRSALNLKEANAEHFKLWLKDNDNVQRQQKLQKVLREIAVQEINRNYELYYRTCYQEQLWSAYENKDIPLSNDDTFITHTHIKNKFKEKLIKEELMQWWENADEATGKSAKDIYFENIQNSARSAHDHERWGGSPEFNALAIFFKINIEWIKGNPTHFSSNKPIPLLGIGSGLIKGLTNPEKLLLRDLGIGDHFGNDFMVKAFISQEELQQAMAPKPEPYNSVSNYIFNCNENDIHIPQSIGDLKVTEEVKSTLREWGVLSNDHFVNDQGRLEKSRILNRLNGVNSKLQKKIIDQCIIAPKFRLQNTGQHWIYLNIEKNKTQPDKNTELKSSKKTSEKGDLSLSTAGLFKDISQNFIIEGGNLHKKHQAMIDGVFQKYYMENIYVLEADSLKEVVKPWQFGYIDYIQACCCGKIFKKEYLAKTSAEEGCPACKSLDIHDQLFCMHLKLFPRSTVPKDAYSTLSLRADLTLTLFKKAIENKRYFILEHLLLIATNKPYINYHTSYGKTLLHYAIESNDAIAALILIKHGANTNALCRFLFRPLDYVDQFFLHEKGPHSENTELLKTILTTYGGLSAHATYLKSEIYSGNNTLSQEGTRLHYACKSVDEALVYTLCENDCLDVNATNSSNHTPLSMLAHYGNMEQCGKSISIIYFLNAFLKNNLKIESRLDVLLRLHEISHIISQYEFPYYQRKRPFNLIDEICDFFSENKKLSYFPFNAFKLNPKSRSNGYFLCPNDIDWSSSKLSLYENDYFEETIDKWLSENVNFFGKLIIPCHFKNSMAIAILTLKRENKETEISVKLNELRGDKGSFFLKRLEVWIRNTFKCTPTFSKNPSSEKPLVAKTRLEIVINAIHFIFHQVEYSITPEECFKAYLAFRVRTPLYLNTETQDKILFPKVMDEFNLESNDIEKLLTITRQDYIIRLLIEKNADIGTQSLFANVFSVALCGYNYRFVKTLIELGITPFAQEKADTLIKSLPYSFHSMAILLYNLSELKYGNEKAILHICVSLIDGDTGVSLSEPSRQIQKTSDLNLIEAFLSNKWEHPFFVKLCGKYLLEITNKNLETPLFTAIRNNNLAAVKILIKQGASLLHKNKDGDYPIELFTRNLKEKGRACYVISQESSRDIQKLWIVLYEATYQQMSRDQSSMKSKVSMGDLERLNEKKLIESVIKKMGSTVSTFICKKTDEFQSDDDNDEELESEEDDSENNDNDEIMEPEEEEASNGNDSDEEMEPLKAAAPKSDEAEEKSVSVKYFNMSKEDLLRLLDKQLQDLNKTTQNNKILPQDFTSILTTLLLALQLMSHLKFEVGKKKEAKLLEILNTIAQQSFNGFLLQALLTIGAIRPQWRNSFLSSLASFLRQNIQEKTNEEGLMIAFLCNLLQTDREDDETILESYISDSIAFSTMKNTSLHCEQFLLNNIDIFTKVAHKIGICCMTDITALLPKKSEKAPTLMDISDTSLPASSDKEKNQKGQSDSLAASDKPSLAVDDNTLNKEAGASPLVFSSKRKGPPLPVVGEDLPTEPACKKQKVVT